MSEIKTNQISSLTGSNSDITLDPDGTGDLIVASGNVGIGTSSPSTILHVEDGDVTIGNSTTTGDNKLVFKNASATLAEIRAADTSTGTGALLFTNNGSERMRIDDSGTVMANTTDIEAGIDDSSGSPQFSFRPADGLRASTSGSHYFNKFNDGTIIVFRGQGTDEGNISINGTTISYNGGHLARWSQATDGNRIDGLVKGTVMTNLDQMAEWTKDGVTEDNEQLNCMAVSSVEGDANVAGVFVNWDDDDEDYTADMNIAMTGDMVIRIASGTTVARGDLLMSAGDGTAKPQDDDIVRSKTIAKVTSTTVSHTYDDGSYLVPCVLMAC